MAQPENLVRQRSGPGLAVAQYPHLPMEPQVLAGQLPSGPPDALRPLLLPVEAFVQLEDLLVPPARLVVEPGDLLAQRPDSVLLVRGPLQGGAPPGRSGPRPGRALTGLRCRQGLAQPGVLLAQRPAAVSKADVMPASERSVSRRATSACKDGTSLAVRRASFVSSTASLSLRRQALNRDFHEPPSLRAATSAQRSSSARASAASARARSRSHCDRQSRGACSGTDTGDNRTPPLPSTSVKPVPKSSSRTTMRTTIAHGKSRYQQKDSTLWGLASTWEMRLRDPFHGLTNC